MTPENSNFRPLRKAYIHISYFRWWRSYFTIFVFLLTLADMCVVRRCCCFCFYYFYLVAHSRCAPNAGTAILGRKFMFILCVRASILVGEFFFAEFSFIPTNNFLPVIIYTKKQQMESVISGQSSQWKWNRFMNNNVACTDTFDTGAKKNLSNWLRKRTKKSCEAH